MVSGINKGRLVLCGILLNGMDKNSVSKIENIK